MAGLLLKLFSTQTLIDYLIETLAKAAEKPESFKPLLVEIKTLRDAITQIVAKLEKPW